MVARRKWALKLMSHNKLFLVFGGDPAGHSLCADRNLEQADVALIDRAEHDIDIAAYVLTDWPVMRALIRAAGRGVRVRIYMDGRRIGEREPTPLFRELLANPCNRCASSVRVRL
jgi:phosphatidylserine/phosphatidylglycerophosphate/cardiolipin synthase-like enzyme